MSGEVPATRYARAPDGAFIAFQVFGAGQIDVLLLPGFFTNLDANWHIREIADTHRRIASFGRVIAMDRRGMGLSDRLTPGDSAPLETHVDDVVAVLDAAKARDVCIVTSESGAPLLALLFAVSHPERVRALAMYTPMSSSVLAGLEIDDGADLLAWGSEAFAREDLETAAPSIAGDAGAVSSWAAYLRAAASPGSAIALRDQWSETDIRDVLPLVSAPTIVITRPGAAHVDLSRPFVAAIETGIPHAHTVELEGRDLPYWIGDRAAFAGELESFFTGVRSVPGDADRALATVMFTDIVDSTAQAAELGDAAWQTTSAHHDAIVRAALVRHEGREIKTMGDGFLATFPGPARGVRAGLEIATSVRNLGIEIRAGLHTGEVTFEGGDVSGIAVAIGARVGALAGGSEVLVSSTVRDLTAGSGLVFEDAGEHELKGVPERWRLYRVVG